MILIVVGLNVIILLLLLGMFVKLEDVSQTVRSLTGDHAEAPAPRESDPT